MPGAIFSFGLKISILTYADDVILLASSRTQLQLLLNACQSHALTNGYAFSPSKCKVLVLHKNYNKIGKLFLGTHALELVESYKYLGIDFETRFLNFGSYLKATNQKLTLRSLTLGAIGMQKDGLRLLTARRIYFALIRPLVDYAAQVLNFNITTTKKFESSQMKFFKKCLGVEISTCHELLRTVIGVEPISCRVAKLKLSHYHRIRDTTNTILGPIITQREPKIRGYTREIEILHTKWNLNPEWDIAEKRRSIETQAFIRDLAKLKALEGKYSCYFLAQQYNNVSTVGSAKYRANNILEVLSKECREHRSAFLQFLFGFSPVLREEKCDWCGYTYDFAQPQTAPTAHLLTQCQKFAQERLTLRRKISESITMHHSYLLKVFQTSLRGDGVQAAAIMLGCNDVIFHESVEKVKCLYRRLKKLKTPSPLDTLVRHTVPFIWAIHSAYTQLAVQ